MVFNSHIRKENRELSFTIDGNILKIVNSYKYLGCVLYTDLSNAKDIEKCTTSFNNSFDMLFRKFNPVNMDMFLQPSTGYKPDSEF